MGLLRFWPPIKCQTNKSLNYLKFAIDDTGSLLNHTLMAPLSVVGKDLHITSSGVCCRFSIILKAPIWLTRSLLSSYNSSCGRRNLRGKRHSKTLVVKGESILLSMPLRFIAVFPFLSFFTSSSSLIKLFIIWSLLCVDCSVCSEVSFPLLFSGLLASSLLRLRLRC